MYDFANSGYTTVVITAVFNAYFVAVVAGTCTLGDFRLDGGVVGLSYALILLTGPVLGAYATCVPQKSACSFSPRLVAVNRDRGCSHSPGPVRSRSPFCCCAFQVLLRFRRKPHRRVPARARQGESLGRVSGWGWASGYLGGLLTLGLCLGYVTMAQLMARNPSSSCRSRC